MRNLKRIFSLLLTIALVLTYAPQIQLKAEAATVTSGYYQYKVSNGEVTIWGSDNSISGNITIPSTLGGYPVTTIGNYAFHNCTGLTSVTIPNSVTSINWHAFQNCTALTRITIPNSVTSIESYAFYNCDSLTRVTIPDSVTNLESWVFYSCDSLTSVTIGNSVPTIEHDSFANCTNLTSVTIGNSVTTIKEFAFSRTGLTSVTIPSSVTTIEGAAFGNCSSLKTIYFDGSAPERPKYDGDVFYGMETATAYYYPDKTWTTAAMQSLQNSDETIIWVSRGCKHSYTATVTQPTCATQGYTTHRCTKCGNSYKDSYTSTKDHNYGTWSKLDDTYHKRTCTVCQSATVKAAHNWDSGVITKQPSCQTGSKLYTCSTCGGTKTEVLAATIEHSYTTEVSPPTCTEQGYTTYTCGSCGYSYRDSYTSAKGHSYSSVVTPPTCKEQGYTTHTCKGCGHSYTDNYTDEAGHSYSNWIEVDGQTHKRICTVCLLATETEIHIYNPGTIKSPATCTEDEVKTYRCIYCEYVRDEVIPDSAKGHTYGDWEQVDETHHKHTCTVCTTHSETKEHTFGEDRVCTDCGYQNYILGDFTGDNEVTDADVIYLLWYTVFPEDYPLNGKLADFTGDNEVTDADVIYLLWHTVFPEDYPLE